MISKPSTSKKYLSSEDYWAIWLGGFILLIGVLGFIVFGGRQVSEGRSLSHEGLIALEDAAPIRTLEWYDLVGSKQQFTAAKTKFGIWVAGLTGNVKTWTVNPLAAFVSSEAEGKGIEKKAVSGVEAKGQNVEALRERARQHQTDAESADWNDLQKNERAEKSIEEWYLASLDYKASKKKYEPHAYNLTPNLVLLGLFMSIIFGLGAFYMGFGFPRFIIGFWGIFVLAILAFLLGAQSDMKSLGFGYALWAILIGMIISNTVGVPNWLNVAARTEYYIKTGLVLLGAEILFGKIMTIGLPGLFVAWVVTPIVLVATYWFGQRILRIGSKTLNITISADMSVCGVSAAIATAAACNAKKEELTLAVGLSMVFTSVMMVVMPAVIKAMHMPEVLGGAWIGGTIDATGAVVAAGAFLGDTALNVAATIKMIQNILIGLIAFFVAVYWAAKVEKTEEARVGFSEIWKRFPKFILGFIGASILFSMLYSLMGKDLGDALIDQGVIRSFSKNLRGWFFCLAFVSIGLSTNFRVLREHFKGGKPLILYITGQAFNLLLTLLMAYLMFYVVFPDITDRI